MLGSMNAFAQGSFETGTSSPNKTLERKNYESFCFTVLDQGDFIWNHLNL